MNGDAPGRPSHLAHLPIRMAQPSLGKRSQLLVVDLPRQTPVTPLVTELEALNYTCTAFSLRTSDLGSEGGALLLRVLGQQWRN